MYAQSFVPLTLLHRDWGERFVPSMGPFDRAAGDELRLARTEAGLTLRDVRVRSGGRFKPSAVGAYERAERAVSLERFVSLARIYSVPADRLLARVVERAC